GAAKDLFKAQDEIAGGIVAAISPELSPATPTATAVAGATPPRGTSDQEAYDLYLRGRFFLQKRGDASLRRALDYFQQAIARDPKFARAHTGVADVYALLPLYSSAKMDSVLPLALASANRAVAI